MSDGGAGPSDRLAGGLIKGVPPGASWLGLAGALPFAGLALLSLISQSWASFALLAYGAVILSFMGGVHWGLAMAQQDSSIERLGMSVVPALIGWVAVLIGGTVGCLLLAASFGGLLLYDMQSTARGQAPVWYPALRKPLTLIVVLSLLAGAIAV